MHFQVKYEGVPLKGFMLLCLLVCVVAHSHMRLGSHDTCVSGMLPRCHICTYIRTHTHNHVRQPEAHANHDFDEADTNKDGVLSMQEYVGLFESFATVLGYEEVNSDMVSSAPVPFYCMQAWHKFVCPW
jgi:hypothetical protein